MEPKVKNFKKYNITYFNHTELKILLKEIFGNEIYKINLKDRPVIFDIGAHIGLATIYFKDMYPNSKIYAFEPNPNVYPLLKENIQENKLSNVKTYNIALGKNNSKRILYIDNSSNNCFSTSSFNQNAWNGKQQTVGITVNTKKLSSYITKDIDLLKIDTEGAELEIIEDLDISNKIKMINNMIIEYHPIKMINLKKIKSILTRNNFKLELRKADNGLIYILGKNIT